MEKVVKLRFVFWSFILIVMAVSILSSSCKKKELESDFPVLVDGAMKINTTYQLKGITEFDVRLMQQDTNIITVKYGPNLTSTCGKVGLVSTHIVVNSEFVRFSSSDYDTKNNIERHNEEIVVSNIK